MAAFHCPVLRNFLETVLETSSAVRLYGGRYESGFVFIWKHMSCMLYIPDTRFLTMSCCRFLCLGYFIEWDCMFRVCFICRLPAKIVFRYTKTVFLVCFIYRKVEFMRNRYKETSFHVPFGQIPVVPAL